MSGAFDNLPDATFDAICDEVEEFILNTQELTEEVDFRSTVRIILSYGARPTPSLLGRLGFGNGRNINGRQSKWRREELVKAGWEIRDGRWYKITFART